MPNHKGRMVLVAPSIPDEELSRLVRDAEVVRYCLDRQRPVTQEFLRLARILAFHCASLAAGERVDCLVAPMHGGLELTRIVWDVLRELNPELAALFVCFRRRQGNHLLEEITFHGFEGGDPTLRDFTKEDTSRLIDGKRVLLLCELMTRGCMLRRILKSIFSSHPRTQVAAIAALANRDADTLGRLAEWVTRSPEDMAPLYVALDFDEPPPTGSSRNETVAGPEPF